MTLLSRVSIAGSRTAQSARAQLTRCKLVDNTTASLCRNLSTEAAAGTSTSRLGVAGNALLGATLVGAGVGTVWFTYLRLQNGMGVAANTIMDDGLHPAAYPWPNNHPFATFDHARYIPSLCH
jgi:ubiquinol-cytochrome c reductase cytochrome c1 subunit